MARNFPADTRGQRALEELYEKETKSQIAWFLKREKVKKDYPGQIVTPAQIAETPVPKLKDVLPSHLMEKISRIQASQEKSKVYAKTPTEMMPVKEQFIEPLPDMFPADQPTQRILYDGISKEGNGRAKYLQTRNKLDLEDKYRYPVLSSMEYGWGQTELIKHMSAQVGQKRRGRVKIVEESFYRRNGIPFTHCSDML
ncbi:hypothetical protein D915_001040 [Fasciola hepatica]|uniref:Sperm microtubule inner protein 1 C-terminal domain-containing protein n=1 Tax=Fasciola hepatica TaxID=6192 RepID=A0A2H1CVU9_FASHE|nr:hypothetical protein D915_001040 [Fasciola hepatica]